MVDNHHTAFTPDGKCLLVVDGRKITFLDDLDLAKLEPGQVWTLPQVFVNPELRCVAVSPNGKTLAIASQDSIKLFDLAKLRADKPTK